MPALSTRGHFQRSCEPCFRLRLRWGCPYFWPSVIQVFVSSSLSFNFSCIDSHIGIYVTFYTLVCPCELFPEDGIVRLFYHTPGQPAICPECSRGVATEPSGSEFELDGETSEDEARRRASRKGGLMDILECWFSSLIT